MGKLTTFTMTEEIDIPFPLRFNSFKHHRNYLLGILESTPSALIKRLLHPICHNYIDLYIGKLSPQAITLAVIDKLKENQVLEEDDFSRWVHSHNGYRHIRLEDQSVWVVRKSELKDRYIHLHPSRTGPLSVRVKGSTFKTICQLKATFPDHLAPFSLGQVNLARQQVGLSPVKRLDQGKGILKRFETFF